MTVVSTNRGRLGDMLETAVPPALRKRLAPKRALLEFRPGYPAKNREHGLQLATHNKMTE
jgi:hypothetical protein